MGNQNFMSTPTNANSNLTGYLDNLYGLDTNYTVSAPVMTQPTTIQAGPTVSSAKGLSAMNNGSSLSKYFGKDGIVGGVSQGVSALTGLYGAYLGNQQLGLAKDQFNLAKNSYNSNMAATVDQYNNTQANRSGIAQAMSGMSENEWANNSSAQSQFAKLDGNKYKV